MSEPDRYEGRALDVYMLLFQPRHECRLHAMSYLCGICRGIIAAALRREHDAALDEAAHRLEEIARDYEGRKLRSVAMHEGVEAAFATEMARAAWRCVKAVYEMKSPAAAPAADQDEVAMFGAFGHGEPSEPAAPAPDLRAAWTAMKMVDDAYWGDFCCCCGVILSLESQDEECGPQHTAVHLVHEWLEKHPEQPPGGAGEGT